jgi:hypothetical protein
MHPFESIAPRIHSVRGRSVMIDAELAALYGVTTKRLNEQVKRNRSRFPEDFAFRLTATETPRWSQIATTLPGCGFPLPCPLLSRSTAL